MDARQQPLPGVVKVSFEVIDGVTGEVKQKVDAEFPAERLKAIDPEKPINLE